MKILKWIMSHPDTIIAKAIYFHRKYRLHKDKANYIRAFLYGLFANYYSRNYNLELYGKFGKNLKISHLNIVINGNAIIGDNVIFHGNNCVGNSEYMGKAPKIGSNVEIGYGAVIIGDIVVADNVVIGANSLVNKSITESGSIVVGNPARVIKYL